jgi:hypothetical protein
MTAAMLGWPQATCASKVEMAAGGRALDVTCEVDGGLQVLTQHVCGLGGQTGREGEERFELKLKRTCTCS